MSENTSSTSSTLSPVQFHEDTIYCTTINGQPFTPMKPIVDNLGLNWGSQSAKLKANEGRWGIAMIAIPSAGGDQEMVCMPVRKLPAYLNTINPRKVSAALREKIIQYQEESDDVLWNYWMNQQREEQAKALPSAAPALPKAGPAPELDEITRDICFQVRQRLLKKSLPERIAVWKRVKAALEGEAESVPSGPTVPGGPSAWDLAPAIQNPKKNHIEAGMEDILRGALKRLNDAITLAGLTVNEGNCPIKGYRRSLHIAATSNINAAGAIIRAMAAAEDIQLGSL